jgi:small subunit ribosomal protein S20
LANHESARKRVRRTARITEHHKHFRSTARGAVKRVRAAIAAGNKTEASEALKVCIKRLDQAVSKGLWHRKTGSRYISRLSAQVHGMS